MQIVYVSLITGLTSGRGMVEAISVSQLNRRVKTLIENGIARLWVEGEISNLSRPASGHIYFSLKDDSAQVSAAWFRQHGAVALADCLLARPFAATPRSCAGRCSG